MIKYFLSVDCAVKTFAYCIVKVDTTNFDYVTKKINLLTQILKMPEKITKSRLSELLSIYEKLKEMVTHYIEIISGDVVNLTDEQHTISKIRALNEYCKSAILPVIATLPQQKLNVMIEFQMGQNPESRTIMIAFAALFIEHNCITVGPSLKNKVYYSEEGRLSNFIQKYSSSHTANKAHTTFNFKLILKDIKSNLREIKNSDLNHIADSFMQIFGYINFSDEEERY